MNTSLHDRFILGIRKIPVVGGLVDCKFSHHELAAREFFGGQFWATLPIWLSAFVIFVQGHDPISRAVTNLMMSGEFFMLAATTLGPIFYETLMERKNPRIFPSRVAHISLVVALIALSSAAFAMTKNGIGTNRQDIGLLSFWFFVASLALLYLTIVYRNSISDSSVEDSIREQELDLAARVAKRRAGHD